MDGISRIEGLLLMGLVTLLGATITLFAAIAGLAISILSALIVFLVNTILKHISINSSVARWALLISTGFLISWIFSSLAIYLVEIPQGAIIYLQLAGISPIVFYGIAREVSTREAFFGWVQFGLVMILIGAVREILGRGTFAGLLTPAGFTIPADFFASPIGAFLIVGALILVSRLIEQFLPNKNGGER